MHAHTAHSLHLCNMCRNKVLSSLMLPEQGLYQPDKGHAPATHAPVHAHKGILFTSQEVREKLVLISEC